MQRYAPDTNFYIQFKSPKELPWAELTKAEAIELTVLQEVLRELDKHKNGGNERRAQRARNTLQLIRPLIVGEAQEISLREHSPRVVYRLAPILPARRAKPATLDTDTADGRIIEEALACQAIVGEVIFLTHDSLPMLTARHHELKVMPLPDAWRLAAESDAKDKEINRLKAELAALQKRTPTIKAQVVVGGEAVNRIESSLPRYAPLNTQFLEHAIEVAQHSHPSEIAGPIGITPAYGSLERASYESKYAQWVVGLRDQLTRYSNLLNFEDSIFPIMLSLENCGTASAESLVVEVFAEGNVRLSSPDARVKMLEKLKFTFKQPPSPPNPIGDVLLGRSLYERLEITPHLPQFFREPAMSNLFAPVGREFGWHFDKPEVLSERLEGACGDFRHQIHKEEIVLAITVPPNVNGEPVGCLRIRYSAKNMVQPMEQVWPVRFNYDWRNTEAKAAELLEKQLDVKLR